MRKRCLVSVLGMMMLLIFFAGACKKPSSEEKTPNAVTGVPIVSEVRETPWHAEHQMLGGSYETAFVRNGSTYGCQVIGDGLLVQKADCTSGSVIREEVIPGMTGVLGITADSGDNAFVLASKDEECEIWKIGPNSAPTRFEIPFLEKDELGEWPVVMGFYAYGDGYLLWSRRNVIGSYAEWDGEQIPIWRRGDKIDILDGEMRETYRDEVPQLLGIGMKTGGRPILLAKDDDGAYLRELKESDSEEPEVTRIEGIPGLEMNASPQVAASVNGMTYLWEGRLHEYRMEDGTDETILDLASCGIFQDEIVYFGMNEVGNPVFVDNPRGFPSSEYTEVREGKGDRTEIALGAPFAFEELTDAVTAYNRYQNKYSVVIRSEMNGGNADEAAERLNLELLRGQGPDVIELTLMERGTYAKDGILLNLYDCMDKDEEVGREAFIEGVLETEETGGRLRAASPAFHLFSVWGSASVVKGRKGLGMDELIGLLRENGGDANSLYGFSADEPILRMLCTLGMDEFVDWDGASCNFEGEEFKNLLKFVKSYQARQFDDVIRAMRSGEILLTLGVISSPEDCTLARRMQDGPVEYLGCPAADGEVETAVVPIGGSLAINAKSEHPDGAWDFVKYYLFHYAGVGMSVVKDRFERQMENAAKENMITMDGFTFPEVKKSYFERKSGIMIEVMRAEPKDVQTVRDMVNGKLRSYVYNNAILDIISEEADAYLAGGRTLDDACKIIQERVTLYIRE